MEILFLIIVIGAGLALYWLNRSTKEVIEVKTPEPLVVLGPEPLVEKTSTVVEQPVVAQPVVEQPVAEQATQSVEEPAPKKRTRKPAAMKVEKAPKKAVKKVK